MKMKQLIIFALTFCCMKSNASPLKLSKGRNSACTQEARDIFLVVDGSASVGYNQFESVRKFILQLITAIKVHRDFTHFGLLQFSTKHQTKIEFGLDDSHHSNVLLDKVRAMKYHGGVETRTGEALGIVEREVFTAETDDRPNVPDLLIIFTDGQATDQSLAYKNAEKLKKNGVRIVAIGAGTKKFDFLEQLERIASSPSDVWMADFDSLDEIVNVIAKDVVNEICPAPPLDHTRTICSQEPKDVFLVIDGSRSIGTTHFEKIRHFVTTLIKAVVVNPNMTHFGLLQFSSREKTRMEFSLDYSHREATLLNRVKYLRYQKGGSTYTGNALRIVEQEVFTTTGDDRPEVEDILIVFTDGAARDQRVARLYADKLKQRNVKIIGIAAGPKRKEFKHQVEEISSGPDDVFMVEFDKLADVFYKLVNKVCKAPPTTIPPTTTPKPTTTLPPTTTPVPTTTPPPPICSVKAKRDILLLLDLTKQMSGRTFAMVKQYLKNLVREMPIENDRFMIGIMNVGDNTQPRMFMKFSRGLTQEKLRYKLNALRKEGFRYNFNIAAYRQAGYEFHNMNTKFGRYDVEDVIILLTTRSLRDRPSWDSDVKRVSREMQMFANMRTKVITVALGRRRRRISVQVKQMKSADDQLILSSYKRLVRSNERVFDVIHAVCPPSLGTRPPIGNCRRTPHDIFFVIDGSASIKSHNFVFVRKFLMDLLFMLRSGMSNIQVGMLQYSEVKKTEILLDLDKYSLTEQMRQVTTMKYQAGRRTMTGDALTIVANEVFNGNPQNGDRPDVQDVLIIFTDGNAHDLPVALKQAEVLKSRGVRVITIGAGVKRDIWRFQHELKQMCSDPKKDFLMVDFQNLDGFANEAFPLICQDDKRRL